MIETIYIVAGGIGLLIAGVGLGYWVARLRLGKQAAKAEEVQQQFDDYRSNVMEHFGRTAEHFQAIGQQYRELYEHMANGADALLDQQAMDEKLSFKPAAALESFADVAPPAPQDFAAGDDSEEIQQAEASPVAADEAKAEERDSATAKSGQGPDKDSKENPKEAPVEDLKPETKPEVSDSGSQRIYH